MKSDTKIIADYLRWNVGEKGLLSDEEVIAEYGAEDTNEIVKKLGNKKYLYVSSTFTPEGVIEWVTVIDENDYSKSQTIEVN